MGRNHASCSLRHERGRNEWVLLVNQMLKIIRDKRPVDDGRFTTFKIPETNSDIYPNNRRAAFTEICRSLSKNVAFKSNEASICHGDSLDLIRNIPSESVDLILTDPPYHSTKKKNIYGDSDFEHDEEYLSWIDDYLEEWKRVLKPNGSLYLFCSSDMSPYIYVNMAKTMNMHGIITWTKPNEPGYDGWKQKMKKTALRRWYPHTERIIFCSPAAEGNLKKSPFGLFLRDCRQHAALSSNLLTEMIGAYGRINNGGAVSNWETGRNIPSRDQYQKICEAFISTRSIQIMPAYEDVIRAFNIDPTKPFIDVWDFMNVRQYRGKHPAEKPGDLLSHIINSSSYPNDVVLDCFSGSGSTVINAIKCGRQSIGIEIEEKWVEYSIGKVRKALTDQAGGAAEPTTSRPQSTTLPLFGE